MDEQNDEQIFIRAISLRKRLGGVSEMWLNRRLKTDPDFPRPRYVGPHRFWFLAEIEAWERKLPLQPPKGRIARPPPRPKRKRK